MTLKNGVNVKADCYPEQTPYTNTHSEKKMFHTEMSKEILIKSRYCGIASLIFKFKWASPEASTGLRFLGKFLIFSGWLIFIQNPLAAINASTLDHQATLNITAAANATHWQYAASHHLFSSYTASMWGVVPEVLCLPLYLLALSAPTQQCQWGCS